MRILSFDSCCGLFSIAILQDHKSLAYYKHLEFNQQAEMLAVKIEDTLQQSNLRIEDLNYIALTIGPGSFTGIKIGIALAKGISVACNIPMLGFTTLEAIAFDYPKENVTIALAAGRGRYYVQDFINGNSASDIKIWDENAFAENKDLKIIKCNLAQCLNLPDANNIALLARNKILQKNYETNKPIQPLYHAGVLNNTSYSIGFFTATYLPTKFF
jgi:tRNA threonylcarbamoyl adenosine modification protein YeaZ